MGTGKSSISKRGPGFFGKDMFDVYSRGNYVGSVKTRKELDSLVEDLLMKLGPEKFEKKNLTAIPSMHFHAKVPRGPRIFRTLSQQNQKGHP